MMSNNQPGSSPVATFFMKYIQNKPGPRALFSPQIKIFIQFPM